MSERSLPEPSSGGRNLEIALLGGFRFWVRVRDADLAPASQRLLAFLALRESPVARDEAAGILWPDASEDHSHASLRSGISRLTLIAHEAVIVSPHSVRLAENVAVDIRVSRALAHRLLTPATLEQDSDLSNQAIAALSADLLPGWYDDWVLIEAEEWRHLRLHALNALTERLIANRSFGDATSAALAAVRAESLRESSHAALIRVHLVEGNRAEVVADPRTREVYLGH